MQKRANKSTNTITSTCIDRETDGKTDRQSIDITAPAALLRNFWKIEDNKTDLDCIKNRDCSKAKTPA